MEKDNFGFDGGSPQLSDPVPTPPYNYPPAGPATNYALPTAQYSGPAHQGAPSTQYTAPQYTTQTIISTPPAQQVSCVYVRVCVCVRVTRCGSMILLRTHNPFSAHIFHVFTFLFTVWLLFRVSL